MSPLSKADTLIIYRGKINNKAEKTQTCKKIKRKGESERGMSTGDGEVNKYKGFRVRCRGVCAQS